MHPSYRFHPSPDAFWGVAKSAATTGIFQHVSTCSKTLKPAYGILRLNRMTVCSMVGKLHHRLCCTLDDEVDECDSGHSVLDIKLSAMLYRSVLRAFDIKKSAHTTKTDYRVPVLSTDESGLPRVLVTQQRYVLVPLSEIRVR